MSKIGFKYGPKIVKKIFFGNTEVKKVFYGNTQLFPKYEALITKGDGLFAAGFNTNSSPTVQSGFLSLYPDLDPTGTTYNAPGSTTLYAFTVLDFDYTAPSDWTLVYGNANNRYATYRVGSTTLSNSNKSYDFGTFNAIAKPSRTITFTSENCTWTNSSQTAVDDDTIDLTTDTDHKIVYCKKQGLTLTNRWTNTAKATSATGTTWTYTLTPSANFTVSTNATIKCIATASSTQAFTITFSDDGGGSWGSSSLTAYRGDRISRSGNTVTCQIGSSLGSTRWTNTFTLNTFYSVDKYTKNGSVWSNAFNVTAAVEIGVITSGTIVECGRVSAGSVCSGGRIYTCTNSAFGGGDDCGYSSQATCTAVSQGACGTASQSGCGSVSNDGGCGVSSSGGGIGGGTGLNSTGGGWSEETIL